jgi:hypothetical protein
MVLTHRDNFTITIAAVILNIIVKWVALWLCIQEVLGFKSLWKLAIMTEIFNSFPQPLPLIKYEACEAIT